jgi:hypothetical protein
VKLVPSFKPYQRTAAARYRSHNLLTDQPPTLWLCRDQERVHNVCCPAISTATGVGRDAAPLISVNSDHNACCAGARWLCRPEQASGQPFVFRHSLALWTGVKGTRTASVKWDARPRSCGAWRTRSLGRPEKLNALNLTMIRQLRAVYDEWVHEKESAIKCIVMEGNGGKVRGRAFFTEFPHLPMPCIEVRSAPQVCPSWSVQVFPPASAVLLPRQPPLLLFPLPQHN